MTEPKDKIMVIGEMIYVYGQGSFRLMWIRRKTSKSISSILWIKMDKSESAFYGIRDSSREEWWSSSVFPMVELWSNCKAFVMYKVWKFSISVSHVHSWLHCSHVKEECDNFDGLKERLQNTYSKVMFHVQQFPSSYSLVWNL